MSILITGVAGFIGFHVAKSLLIQEEVVIGCDNLNDYYDVNLKKARLQELRKYKNFTFYPYDITKHEDMNNLANLQTIEYIVHLAAQAGVRYSLQNPYIYVDTNIHGQLNILELSRKLPIKHLVYASSSSVYGANTKLPFSIEDRVDMPISVYAATKRSAELMTHAYSHLYGIHTTGLRFFTVYGPWGRPDMAAFIFTQAILAEQELPVFNNGNMRRNFTYIDDIVSGTIACMRMPPDTNNFKLYNLGNSRSEPLLDFINILATLIGKPARFSLQPMQPGDVQETIADISTSTRDFGFTPCTNIQEGLTNFITWYKDFYHV